MSMTEPQPSSTQPATSTSDAARAFALPEHERADNGYAPSRLMEYLNVIYPWRKFIVIGTLFATLVATVVSFLLPEWYKSSATILVPPQSDLVGLTRLLGGATGFGSNLGSAAESVFGKSKTADDIDRTKLSSIAAACALPLSKN
jgi:hypothetical protein